MNPFLTILKKNKGLKNFYDKVYIKGEKKHFTTIRDSNSTHEMKEVLAQLTWKSKKVLDVGCGSGYLDFKVAKKGGKVLGIDYSSEAIKIAKSQFVHPNLEFKKMDVNEITGKFDVIVSLGTLEHMDEPLSKLKLFKKHLNKDGQIIITSPNWTNPRGYILLTLWYLFDAPITLADIHYQTPMDFMKYAKKLNLNLEWKTMNRSWSHGEILLKDFQKRLPNVLKSAGLPYNPKKVNSFIKWLKENVLPFDNSLPQSGAIGLYVFSRKIKKNKTQKSTK